MSTELPSAQLQPMSLSDILDAIFRLYRNNFFTFLGVIALIQVPIMILQGIVTLGFGQGYVNDVFHWSQALSRFNPATDTFQDLLTELPTTNLFLFLGLLMLIGLVQGVVAQPLMLGALANAIAHRYLNRSISIVGAYAMGMGRIATLIAVQFLVGLIIGTIAILLYVLLVGSVVALIMGMSSSGNDDIFRTMGLVWLGIFFIFVVMVPVVIFLSVRLMFVIQTVVLEGQGILGSIGRSWRLVRGSFWRVLGIVIILGIMVSIIAVIPSMMFSIMIQLVFNPFTDAAIVQTLNTLMSYLINIFTTPIYLVGLTLLYYDLRVRKEGYDMELMMQQSQVFLNNP